MNTANINVITVGSNEVAMPASATVGQRRFVRGWLSRLDSDDNSADIVVEKHGTDREIRVSFLGGDGRRQQMVIGAEGDGSYAEGPYLGEFEGHPDLIDLDDGTIFEFEPEPAGGGEPGYSRSGDHEVGNATVDEFVSSVSAVGRLARAWTRTCGRARRSSTPIEGSSSGVT
ncbi:hypothetical protein ACFXPA_41385 [Amycolatopsis sp. NPDC059090]|uniref:hypothetical protein n=1 Tax=Amycolatopsis sp. NPDC059090 TaxID=3346723 RepID=UPI0036716773